jgi:membrane peptidoglycan carboxypeptidase
LRDIGLILVTATTLLVGAGFTALASVYLQAAADLPDVSSLPNLFGSPGQEAHRPARLYDRSGQVLLFELVHPLAAERRWQPLGALPPAVADATVAALDPTFWTNRGYPDGMIERSLLAVLTGAALAEAAPTLTERLVDQTLTTPVDLHRPPAARAFRASLLAGDVSAHFSKEQILEWFLNSADFGHLAFGIDAAALVYFGKHADALTLSEAALLASLPAHPESNPIDEPKTAEANRRDVLGEMERLELLTAAEIDAASRDSVTVRSEEARRALDGLGFVVHAWNELKARLGQGLALQGALTVVTTLDTDLQLQTDCVVRTQLARLAGGDPAAVEAAADGSTCVAAGLLPLLRPGDTGRDHGVERAAAVILDAGTGEILALSGPAEEARPGGTTLEPFTYLTAFAKGYTPATMVIDAPMGAAAADGTYHGPVRMRVALANSYSAAAERVLALAGVENVARTAASMGWLSLDPSDVDALAHLTSGDIRVALTELSYTYTAIANRGRLAGARAGGPAEGLGPILVKSVLGPDGSVLYGVRPDSQAVLSPPLAYLMENVLSDEASRWPTYGQGSPLELGRPAGVQVGVTDENTDNWTIGFTPSRVVGVRVGSANGSPLQGIQSLNGAAPIWQALLRYAARDLPAEAWQSPDGISVVEVCDPSGYLPTPYCPNVVREVFLSGTEPTHADALYQPYEVNRETGKLATLFTPPELVEERVFFVPPPEAEGWARQAGIEPPPTDYDTYAAPPVNPQVMMTAPEPFTLARGSVTVRGNAEGEGFAVYRVRYGVGLNPRAWVQVGEDGTHPANGEVLGRWDTIDLDGLYTLQLMVVRQDGTIETASVPVAVDNQPPEIHLVLPAPGSVFAAAEAALIQAEAIDASGVVRVDFFVDGERVGTATAEPWSLRWPLGSVGEHTVSALATDRAGNSGESEAVDFVVER